MHIPLLLFTDSFQNGKSRYFIKSIIPSGVMTIAVSV